jgi:hypothetical protein
LRNLSFKNASVHITYEDRYTPSKGAPLQARTQVIDTIFDNSGRGYLDLVETLPEESPAQKINRKLTMTVNESAMGGSPGLD